MKTYLPFVLATLLLIVGCKKENTDSRTGLVALTDPKASNYCVFVSGADTVVMQNTTNDTVILHSGKSKSFFGMWDYIGAEYFSRDPNSAYKSIAIKFTKPSRNLNTNHDCNFPNDVIVMGRNHMISGGGDDSIGVYLWLVNRNGTSASSDRNITTTFTVESITDIPNSSGCKKVRMKANFNTLSFYNSICGPVPQFTVQQCALQMDFMVDP